MSDEQKRPSLSDERFANWCVDSFEDQKDRYHAFVGEQSRWIDVLESRLRVSEAEHQAKIKEMQEEFNSYCAKTQANCNHCAVKHTEKIEVLEGENVKLKIEVEQLKAVRDALEISNKNALADRNTFIKKAEGFEGENAKLLKRIEKLYRLNAEIHTERSNLRERLEAIRQWREKYKDKPVGVWAMSELGVLLSEPKELDQKTREGDIK